MADGMTVGDLRKIIADLPDEMLVASYDAGGYLAWEFCGASVVDPLVNHSNYPQPDRPYLEISAA